MRRIAKELDSTTGLLTHYFASKEDIFLYVIDRAAVALRSMAVLPADPRSDPVEELIETYLASLPVEEPSATFWAALVCFRAAIIGEGRLATAFADYLAIDRANMRPFIDAAAGPDADEIELERMAMAIQYVFFGLGLALFDDPVLITRAYVASTIGPLVRGILVPVRTPASDDHDTPSSEAPLP